MPDVVTVPLDTLAVLAARLGLLAAELAEEAGLTRATGSDLGRSLSGPAARELTAAGLGWASLVTVLSDRTRVLATTLSQAVASYRQLDGLLSESLSGRHGYAAVAR